MLNISHKDTLLTAWSHTAWSIPLKLYSTFTNMQPSHDVN